MSNVTVNSGIFCPSGYSSICDNDLARPKSANFTRQSASNNTFEGFKSLNWIIFANWLADNYGNKKFDSFHLSSIIIVITILIVTTIIANNKLIKIF